MRSIDSAGPPSDVGGMPVPARLQTLAFCVLAILPAAMAVANRSAPALLVGAAVASLSACALSGDLGFVRRRALDALRAPVALACLAFGAVAAASLAWSHHPRLTATALLEVALAVLGPLVLHVTLPAAIPRRVLQLAGYAIGLGCALILAELATGLAARAALGFRSETFIFKRSVTSILIVFWPVAALLWRDGSRAVPLGLGAALLAAILWSHAAAALLGLAVGVGCLLLAWQSRKVASAVCALGLVAALGLAPVLGNVAARVLPERMLDALHESQARDRVLIWQSFGEVIRARPLLGIGFGTSAAAGRDPVAAAVPDDRRLMLSVGHPHNGFLQVWAETGALGALAAAAALILVVLQGRRSAAGLAAIACAGAIMLVAHGAWQGWWVATLGAAALWLARDAETVQAGSSLRSGSPRNPVAIT